MSRSSAILVLLASASLAFKATAQEGARIAGRITGVVVSAGTDQPVAGASIAVLSVNDSALVGGGFANVDSIFHIEGVGPGGYTVRVRILGFAPAVKRFIPVATIHGFRTCERLRAGDRRQQPEHRRVQQGVRLERVSQRNVQAVTHSRPSGFHDVSRADYVEFGRVRSQLVTNVALRQKVFGDQGSVTLRLMDPFNMMRMGFVTDDLAPGRAVDTRTY